MTFFRHSVSPCHSYKVRFNHDTPLFDERAVVERESHRRLLQDKYVVLTPRVYDDSIRSQFSFAIELTIVEEFVVEVCWDKLDSSDLLQKYPNGKIVLQDDDEQVVVDLYRRDNPLKKERYRESYHGNQIERMLGYEMAIYARALCFEEVKGEALGQVAYSLVNSLLFGRDKIEKEVKEAFPKTIQNRKDWKFVEQIVPGYVYRGRTKKLGDLFLLASNCLPMPAIDENGVRKSIGLSDLRIRKGKLVRGDDSSFEEVIATLATSDCINDRNLGKHMTQLRKEADEALAKEVKQLEKQIADLQEAAKPNYKSS